LKASELAIEPFRLGKHRIEPSDRRRGVLQTVLRKGERGDRFAQPIPGWRKRDRRIRVR
jgi:hypothetical protein